MRNILILIAAIAMSFSFGYSIRPEPVERERTLIVSERVACTKADVIAAAVPVSALGRK
jgi:hypothetical protein